MSTEKRKGFFSRVFGKAEQASDQDTTEAISGSVEANPINNPTPEPQAKPEAKPQTEPKAEPQAEPVAKETPKPVAEKTPQPEVEPIIEPAEQPVAEKTPQPEVENAAKTAPIIKDAPSKPEQVTATATDPQSGSEPKGWYSRLQSGLAKTSSKISNGIAGIFTQSKLDENSIQDLEDILIQSDLGVSTSSKITDRIAASRYDKDLTPDDIRNILSEEVSSVLKPVAIPLMIDKNTKPHVIMMIGVNGAGKTTTIGKLASQFRNQGKKVMLVAGDTFRAAAVDQLDIWADRTGASFMSRDLGADAAGLAFDAIKSARKSNTDIVMIDTAGRLQNKATLMAELVKIIRVIKKLDATAPHSVILILDATTGQNALNQVEIFLKEAGVTGIIMTKLDGTARGGILVAIAEKFALPIHAIGVGEQIDDLQAFDPTEFANAIANK